MSNPNFPAGERRGDDPSKDLSMRIPNRSNPVPLPMVVSQHQSFQGKSAGRAIAPAPGAGSQIGKPTVHQISSLTPAALKKEVHKAPLTMAPAPSISPVPIQSPAGIPNIIQISATTASHSISALQVPNVSCIVRGSTADAPTSSHVPTPGFSHLPRGAVVAANSALVRPAHSSALINVPRATTPTAIQVPAAGSSHVAIPPGLHGPIRGTLMQPSMRSGTPPSNRSGSPAVSVGAPPQTDTHRPSISLHSVTSVGTTPSIQITLQASRSSSEPTRPTSTYQPSSKVHMNQGINMTSQQKVVMSQTVTPGMQHPTLAAKSNKGPPMSSAPISTVTVALSTTTVTIPIMSSATTSSSIPIAKVTPQRQLQSQSAPAPGIQPTAHEQRSEATSFPQPQPAHAHTHTHNQNITQTHTLAHSQPATSIIVPQAHRASPSVASSISANTITPEAREGIPAMSLFPHLMLSPDYQSFFRHQVAVAQAQAQQVQGRQSGVLPNPSLNLAASLQAAHNIAPGLGSGVRINPMVMTVPDGLRHPTPQSTHAQFPASESSATSVTATGSDTSTLMSSIPVQMSGSTATGLSSNLYSTSTQQSNIPHGIQSTPGTPSSMTGSNPSASPRPSILRKRPNEGVGAVKKQLALTSTSDTHSPRPEVRPDSTPQSNTSSPKTPASGESQSSTDTALSSEGTTPTGASQNSIDEVKVKQEPADPHENGFSSNSMEASPRKKPRKQLLHATEELKDTPSTEDDFNQLVEACVKEEKPSVTEVKQEIRDEYVDEDGVRWTTEKKRTPVSLLNFYNISWKPKNNHFQRYTDVKPKDERRPTVNELSNQKGVMQKASGWKLFHMAAQIEDLVELEKELNTKISQLQSCVAPHPPIKHSVVEDEPGMLHELTQGNIQRCQLVSDQLGEAKSAMLKVLDHKNRILEIITKHMSKRPIKKKERT